MLQLFLFCFCTKITQQMKNTMLLIFAAIAFALDTVSAETIYVNSQYEFDALVKNIEAAVKGGADIVNVEIAKGTFYFRNRQIELSNHQWDSVVINIHGNETLLAPYDTALRDTSLPSPLQQTDRLIEITDENKKLCRLHLTDTPPAIDNELEEMRITITQWFKSITYKVERISEEWVYFTAGDLSYNDSFKCHNVNLDYGYSLRKNGSGVMPRYRLESDRNSRGEACRLLSINGCTLGSFTLSGVSVQGNKDTTADYLVYINNSYADSITLHNCHFQGIRSSVIQAQGCSNLHVSNNTFQDCYRGGLFANYCEGTVIVNNEFINMGLACNNNYCIRVSGKNYYVAHNRLVDFGYGGIAVGTWWKGDKRMEEVGVVEHNTLCYSAPYFVNIAKRGLMDRGAIYIYTQNDDVEVRYNFIHDYTGMCDNRGIFCDDGACHFQLYGNVIVNTPNGYSIDSRYTPNVVKDPQSKTQVINTDNHIYDNVIDGGLRFEGREEESDCTLGENIVLTHKKRDTPTNILKNLSSQRSPKSAAYKGVENETIIVPAATMQRIAKLNSHKEMLHHFKTR